MVLIIRYNTVFDIITHFFQLRSNLKITFFTWNSTLCIQIFFNAFIFKHITEHFIGCLFIFTIFHHAEHQIISGIQHIFIRIFICRKYKRTNIHIRIYRFDLRDRIASNCKHRRCSSCECSAGIVISLRHRIFLSICKKRFFLFCHFSVIFCKSCFSTVYLISQIRIAQTYCNCIPRCQCSPCIFKTKI